MSEFEYAGDTFRRLVQALHHDNCTEFSLEGSSGSATFKLTEQDWKDLAAAIDGNTSLRKIKLPRDITNDRLAILGPALQNHRYLREITGSYLELTDEGFALFAELLCGHPTIECINLESSFLHLSIETFHKFSQLITNTANLGQLVLFPSAPQPEVSFSSVEEQEAFTLLQEEGAWLLENAARSRKNSNLVSLIPSHRDVDGNRIAWKNAEDTKAFFSALKSFPPTEIPLQMLCAASARMPGLHYIGGDTAAQEFLSEVEEIIEQLPFFKQLTGLTPEELLAPNKDGFSCLDNPKIWSRFTTIARRLTQYETPLTRAQLMQPNKEGIPYLFLGITCRKTDAILAHLNAQGEYLSPDDLLDGKEPNALLNAIIEHDDVNKLFTLDNWRGQGANAMLRVYRALPESAKEHVAGIQALTARLSRSPAPKMEI